MRKLTEAEILLERQTIKKLTDLGAQIVAHMSFRDLSEKVQDQLAKTMQADILEITGAVGSVRDIKTMLLTIDPNITFIQLQKFNRATGQNEILKTTVYHDTIDEQIKNTIGMSMQDLYEKAEINKNKTAQA
jgi:hypothetical protein